MTDKKNPSDNRQTEKGKGTPTWDHRPVYDGDRIGDRIDTNNETRGTGPRAPNTIKDGGKGKKR